MCMTVFPKCVYIPYVEILSKEARIGHWGNSDCIYRWLLVSMWVVGIKFGPSWKRSWCSLPFISSSGPTIITLFSRYCCNSISWFRKPRQRWIVGISYGLKLGKYHKADFDHCLVLLANIFDNILNQGSWFYEDNERNAASVVWMCVTLKLMLKVNHLQSHMYWFLCIAIAQ